MAFVSDLCRRLGLTVNSKSNLAPSQEVEYLCAVFHFDSLTQPQLKVDLSFLRLNTLLIRQCFHRYLESLLGVINCASNFVPLRRLHMSAHEVDEHPHFRSGEGSAQGYHSFTIIWRTRNWRNEGRCNICKFICATKIYIWTWFHLDTIGI